MGVIKILKFIVCTVSDADETVDNHMQLTPCYWCLFYVPCTHADFWILISSAFECHCMANCA